jgi:nitroimidazol reductase NimA-like FMN-containing flavoprotein (pyridoxamine 5'-phosphate oxidase superfamily)
MRATADMTNGHRIAHGGYASWSPTPPSPTCGSSASSGRPIAPGGVGRIAFNTGSGPVVLPVNFAVLADTLVIRTAEGTIIDGHADEQVALEIDHIDEALCQGWSVLVRGSMHRVMHPADLRLLQEDAVARRRARGLHAHHSQPDHGPPHRDPVIPVLVMF